MLYVISKDSELGNLVELYQNLDDAMQRRLMGYLEALWELSNGREIRLKKVQLQCELPEKSTLKTVFSIPHHSISSSLPSINARISSSDLSL